MDNEDLIKIRDIFRENADIIDEMLLLDERGNKGEDVKEELDGIIGRFTINMVKLSELQ